MSVFHSLQTHGLRTLLLCAGLALCAQAQAVDVINIDVNTRTSPTFSGKGAFLDLDGNSQTSTPRSFWNGVVAPVQSTDSRSSGSLLLSDGTTRTGVSISFNTLSVAVNVPGSSIVPSEAVALMQDGASPAPGFIGGSVTVSGLLPNTHYLVAAYGRSPDPVRPVGSNFTFGSRNGGAFVSTFYATDGSDAKPGAVRLTSGRDYALVNAKSDGQGRLTLQYFVGVLNGLQIVGSFDTQTIFSAQTPADPAGSDDGVPYELGTRIRPAVNGYITAVRFWRPTRLSAAETPQAKVYAADGALLAATAFPSLEGVPATGWHQVELPTALRVEAGRDYVVSVTSSGPYSIAIGGAADVIGSGGINTSGAGAGVFGPPGAMPTRSWNNSHYFRDVVFVAMP